MKNEKIRELLNEDTVVFENPSYDNSIIGISTSGSAIYSLNKMIEELMSDENWTYDEALEFIEYNTIRALSYFPQENKPIIMEDLLNED